jgi:hypothetical protein
MQIASQASAVAGALRPSLESLASYVPAPRVRSASRIAAGSHAMLHEMPLEAVRLGRVLRRALRSPACLSERTALHAGGGALPERDASTPRSRVLAAPLHNRSFDTDTQRHCAARRAGEHTPRGAIPLRAGQLQRYTAGQA